MHDIVAIYKHENWCISYQSWIHIYLSRRKFLFSFDTCFQDLAPAHEVKQGACQVCHTFLADDQSVVSIPSNSSDRDCEFMTRCFTAFSIRYHLVFYGFPYSATHAQKNWGVESSPPLPREWNDSAFLRQAQLPHTTTVYNQLRWLQDTSSRP